MIRVLVLALTPFFGATFIAATSSMQPPYLQYGALGLCGAVVVYLCRFLNKVMDQMREKDIALTKLTQKNIEAYNRLAEMLKDRPCLKDDHRIDS